ncbi:MAG: extracellular solute-binding protein, partial [Oscillospiraceae bacterium]
DLAPNIRLIKDDNVQDDLISGEVNAAIMYTSQVTMAKLANPTLKIVFPSEGDGFGIMANFIPSKAPNADGAHKFIDYILRPEVSAKCFEALGYYCTNKAAESLINEKYRDFLILPESFKSPEMIMPISPEAEEAHAKAWTTFKNACGQ